MGRLRVLISFIFILASIAFGSYQIKTKMVEDNKPPVITCSEDTITVSVEDGDEALLKGIKAEDNRDGDITDSVRVSSVSHFINGKRMVKYAVFDKANNVGVFERTASYSDYTSPKIYLKKPLRFFVNTAGKLDFSECYSAEDCLDGNLTNQVRLITEEDYYTMMEGTYALTMQVNNSAGDVCSLPVELQIIFNDNDEEREKEYPVLTEYIVYTSVNKKIIPSKYLTGLARGDMEYEFDELMYASKGDIKVKSNVDYSKPGIYTIEFSYKAEGAKKAVTKMYVVVEE